jgi:hypothetical protein
MEQGANIGLTYNYNETNDAWCSTNEVIPSGWMGFYASFHCLESFFVLYSNLNILMKLDSKATKLSYLAACDEDY